MGLLPNCPASGDRTVRQVDVKRPNRRSAATTPCGCVPRAPLRSYPDFTRLTSSKAPSVSGRSIILARD